MTAIGMAAEGTRAGEICRASTGRPIHVLFVIDRLREPFGGAESMLMEMLRRLPEYGIKASLVTFVESNEALSVAVPCEVYPLALRRTYDWNALKVARRLRRLIQTKQVDVVHTFFETSDLWAGPIARLSGVPVWISSRRDMGILRAGKHHRAYRLASRFCDLVLSVSDGVREFCIAADGLDAAKVVTLYNGVSLDGNADASDELRIGEALQGASHVISTVGNIRHVKGVDVLVRTAAKVCARYPGARFLVAGGVLEAEYFASVQQLARELNVEQNVVFLGHLRGVAALLARTDVFCLLSRNEGFSNALVQAMACQLPCVVTDVGGNGEAISEGETGYLVASEDSDSAAERVLRLLDRPSERREMGQRARQVVDAKFTYEAMMKQLTGIYRRLIATKNRAMGGAR